jgi:hypothetical protein
LLNKPLIFKYLAFIEWMDWCTARQHDFDCLQRWIKLRIVDLVASHGKPSCTLPRFCIKIEFHPWMQL